MEVMVFVVRCVFRFILFSCDYEIAKSTAILAGRSVVTVIIYSQTHLKYGI